VEPEGAKVHFDSIHTDIKSRYQLRKISEQIFLTGRLDRSNSLNSTVIIIDETHDDTTEDTFLEQSSKNSKICSFLRSNDISVKICLVGPANSGKTELIRNYVSYKRGHHVTQTSDIERINFLYKGTQMVDVEIWDTVGLEKYHENFIYS
jgi:hypothetical protein